MIKAIDVQTEAKFDLAQAGEGNWLDWLADQGYLISDRISLGHACLELYQRDGDGVYSLYHPPLLDLSVECLFINIPDEAVAQELISLAQRMAKIMACSIQTWHTNTLGNKTA
ncbi:hypothetical protein H6F75_26005 [Nodosilinea sp. FACHB-131]|uniref:hypothetical protein n=1 Tax=Cyanophyceae TaxID=3028117 RepID=UPI0016848578|nr:hypothetical protein [Nodosilinea sp. FACHB-131]MBD1876943.1 hypothetical protein [Nodosilinea sp. FACHB-131]